MISLISTLLLVVVMSPFPRLALANPVPWPSTPIQDTPTLTIQSPTNDTVCENGALHFNFTVAEPDSWRREGEMMIPSSFAIVASVNVSLDRNTIYSTTYSSDINYSAVEVRYDGSSHFSIPQQASLGMHVLNVTVLSYSYYRGPAYNGSHILSSITSSSGPVYQYPLVVSDIIYFTIEQPTQPEPFPTTLVGASVATVAFIVVGLLFYFKKRHARVTDRQ